MTTTIQLNQAQKGRLLNIKKKHQSSLIRDRAQAVLARNQGLTIANIAQALSRSEDFIKRSIKKFQEGELEIIKFTGNNRKLSTQQVKEIIETITTQCPRELANFKFNTQFWSSDILKKFIKTRYQFEYKTDRSYYNLFKQAGFSFHKPKTKDFRQDPEKIKKFKGALKKSLKSTKIRLSW